MRLGLLVICIVFPWISAKSDNERIQTKIEDTTGIEFKDETRREDGHILVDNNLETSSLASKENIIVKKENEADENTSVQIIDQSITPEQIESKSCKDSEFLITILTTMLNLLKRDVPENMKTSYLLQILKVLLKATPEAAEDHEIMYKINDLLLALEKYHVKGLKDNKFPLRTLHTDSDSLTGVKSKNFFKYEFPHFKNPNCTSTLLTIIKVVQDIILRLVSNPLCKSDILKSEINIIDHSIKPDLSYLPGLNKYPSEGIPNSNDVNIYPELSTDPYENSPLIEDGPNESGYVQFNPGPGSKFPKGWPEEKQTIPNVTYSKYYYPPTSSDNSPLSPFNVNGSGGRGQISLNGNKNYFPSNVPSHRPTYHDLIPLNRPFQRPHHDYYLLNHPYLPEHLLTNRPLQGPTHRDYLPSDRPFHRPHQNDYVLNHPYLPEYLLTNRPSQGPTHRDNLSSNYLSHNHRHDLSPDYLIPLDFYGSGDSSIVQIGKDTHINLPNYYLPSVRPYDSLQFDETSSYGSGYNKKLFTQISPKDDSEILEYSPNKPSNYPSSLDYYGEEGSADIPIDEYSIIQNNNPYVINTSQVTEIPGSVKTKNQNVPVDVDFNIQTTSDSPPNDGGSSYIAGSLIKKPTHSHFDISREGSEEVHVDKNRPYPKLLPLSKDTMNPKNRDIYSLYSPKSGSKFSFIFPDKYYLPSQKRNIELNSQQPGYLENIDSPPETKKYNIPNTNGKTEMKNHPRKYEFELSPEELTSMYPDFLSSVDSLPISDNSKEEQLLPVVPENLGQKYLSDVTLDSDKLIPEGSDISITGQLIQLNNASPHDILNNYSPKQENTLSPNKKILIIIKDNISVIERIVPKIYFNVIIRKNIKRIKELLASKRITVEKYVNIVNQYETLIKYIKKLDIANEILKELLVSMTNGGKLESQSGKSKMIELTYLVKRPTPLVYQPYYYIKYQLPYMSFWERMQKFMVGNQDLGKNPSQLYKALIPMLKVAETSRDLERYDKEDIPKITFNNGTFVGAKVITEKYLDMYATLQRLKEINSDFTIEDLFQLITDLDEKLKNTTEDNIMIYANITKPSKNSRNSDKFKLKVNFDPTNDDKSNREDIVPIDKKPMTANIVPAVSSKMVTSDNIIENIVEQVNNLRSNNSAYKITERNNLSFESNDGKNIDTKPLSMRSQDAYLVNRLINFVKTFKLTNASESNESIKDNSEKYHINPYKNAQKMGEKSYDNMPMYDISTKPLNFYVAKNDNDNNMKRTSIIKKPDSFIDGKLLDATMNAHQQREKKTMTQQFNLGSIPQKYGENMMYTHDANVLKSNWEAPKYLNQHDATLGAKLLATTIKAHNFKDANNLTQQFNLGSIPQKYGENMMYTHDANVLKSNWEASKYLNQHDATLGAKLLATTIKAHNFKDANNLNQHDTTLRSKLLATTIKAHNFVDANNLNQHDATLGSKLLATTIKTHNLKDANNLNRHNATLGSKLLATTIKTHNLKDANNLNRHDATLGSKLLATTIKTHNLKDANNLNQHDATLGSKLLAATIKAHNLKKANNLKTQQMYIESLLFSSQNKSDSAKFKSPNANLVQHSTFHISDYPNIVSSKLVHNSQTYSIDNRNTPVQHFETYNSQNTDNSNIAKFYRTYSIKDLNNVYLNNIENNTNELQNNFTKANGNA